MKTRSQTRNSKLKKSSLDPRDTPDITSIDDIDALKLKLEHLKEFKIKYYEKKEELQIVEQFKDESQDELIESMDEFVKLRYHYTNLQYQYSSIFTELNALKTALMNTPQIKKLICNKCCFPGHKTQQCPRINN